MWFSFLRSPSLSLSLSHTLILLLWWQAHPHTHSHSVPHALAHIQVISVSFSHSLSHAHTLVTLFPALSLSLSLSLFPPHFLPGRGANGACNCLHIFFGFILVTILITFLGLGFGSFGCFGQLGQKSTQLIFKMGQPRPLFHLFLSFCADNFISSQQDSNSDLQSRRQVS